MEDVLLDCLIAEDGSETIKSVEDATLFTETRLRAWVTITDAMIVGNVFTKLALRLLLWSVSSEVSKTPMKKLLTAFKKTVSLKTPLVNLMQAETKEPEVCLMVPDIADTDEASMKTLSVLVLFCSVMHGAKVDNIKILKEKSLGTTVVLPKTVLKTVEALTAAAKDPMGSFPGDQKKYSTGFKANLPTMLSVMRLLTMKQDYIRKRQLAKGQSSVSHFELQSDFNSLSGIKVDEKSGYGVNLVKAICYSSTKPRNGGFPGSFIHASRKINEVKSDLALISKLGWTELSPSQHKLSEVLFNTVDEDMETRDGKTFVTKRSLVNITQDKRNFVNQEFRTAVALSLPRLDPASAKPMDEQLKVDPLSHKKRSIFENFKDPSRALLVDRLNESYAFRVSLKNPKSKTKEVHYKISRDRLLAQSANIPLIDSTGRTYPKLGDIPEQVVKYLRKKYNYPEKRSRDEAPPTQVEGEHMVLDPEQGSAGIPAGKRRKITKGQAKASVRKSGRIAQKNKS